MTAKPPNLSETMAAIRRAILDRDDAIRRTRLRRQAGKHIANTALEAVIRAAIEDYTEGKLENSRNATKTALRNSGELRDELSELRPKLHNAETVRDELRRERDDLGARLDKAVTEITAGREQIADLQGQLAIGADHLCEPLPQRTRQVNAGIREGLDAAAEPTPAAPATPAKTRNGTGSRPGRSHRAATTKTRTSGGVDNPKPGESFTEPPA